MWTNAPKLADADPELFASIQAERARQEAHIELIASENYCSPAVMEAQGSELTNNCLLYTSPSPRDKRQSRMPSSA